MSFTGNIRMKKSVVSFFAFAVLSSFALSGCGSEEIKIGTAAQNSKYFQFAEIMKNNLAKQDKYNLTILTSAGSAANVTMLNKDEIQLALVQNDVSSDAYHAVGFYKGGLPMNNFAAIASLYTESCHVVVGANSSIRKMSDLAGKKVSIGELHSGTEQNAKQILAVYGITGYKIKTFNFSYEDATSNLIKGNIDAMFVTGGVKMPVLVDLSKLYPIRLIPLDDNEIRDILSNHNFYTRMTIPSGSYNGQTEAVDTVGIKTLLVASRSMSNEDVEKITGNLFSNASSFSSIMPPGDEISEKNAVEGVAIPFHRGAVKYYHSKNIRVKAE